MTDKEVLKMKLGSASSRGCKQGQREVVKRSFYFVVSHFGKINSKAVAIMNIMESLTFMRMPVYLS